MSTKHENQNRQKSERKKGLLREEEKDEEAMKDIIVLNNLIEKTNFNPFNCLHRTSSYRIEFANGFPLLYSHSALSTAALHKNSHVCVLIFQFFT